MIKMDLNPYIPERMRQRKGRTLQAVYFYFLDGLTVLEAAEKAGITRITANTAISRVKRALMCDGWRTTTAWKKPARGMK